MLVGILSCFYPFRGGIAQFNANLFAELGKRCTVKAFNFKRQYPSLLFPGKTQYVTPEDEAVSIESTALLDTVNPFSWIRTAREIRKLDPDILILRYWMPFFAPSLGFVARRMKNHCKVIGILDNVIPHERHWFDTPLTRYFLSGLDGCVTLCHEVSEDLKKLDPEIPFTVLPHPIYSHFGEKPERRAAENALNLEHGLRNILFFGLIREYKGLDILLKAFDLIGPGYQLIVAGEPYGSFEKYQALIDSSPYRERIHVYPDYIKDSEVKLYFGAADVVALPYRSATQSGISSISYHFEVPLIVTDTGGLKETIGERGTGIVTSEKGPEAIAEAIKAYFADPNIREGCVEAIRSEKERLGWKKFSSDLLLFTETINQA